MSYYITALRSSGERVYLVNNETQGKRMVPNSYSRAETLDLEESCQRLGWAKQYWKGLKAWEICQWQEI